VFRLAPAILVAAALAMLAGAPERPARSGQPIVRGMTVSCQTWGWEWGSDGMLEAMDELQAIGVNWIAIHPYAGIRGDGRVVMPERWSRDHGFLTRPIAEAHARGMKIMIKPHLAYWGSPFSWRGDIAFETDEQWRRFFETYEAWIAKVAEICADADAFVVGTELDRTIHHEAAWRRIIRAVDERTDAPLTYSANWSDYERVPFWDALDCIGIQAYFPLTEHEEMPEPDELAAAWRRLLARLEAYAARHDRDLVLGELGYDRTVFAAVRPWEGRRGRDREGAEETQRRCLDAALAALPRGRRVVGAFLWKWFAGPTTHENFLKSTPAMQRVIAEHWRRPPAE
jgi:hypothetical protein